MGGIKPIKLVKDKVYFTTGYDKNSIIFRADINKYNDNISYKSFLKGSVQKYYTNSTANSKEALSNIREATQDEIEWLEACEKAGKFVDKPIKKEFIVGKWYKGTSDYFKGYYIKFSNLRQENSLICGETIDECGIYRQVDNWSTPELILECLNNGPLEDLSEIQQYLPKDHPDLIKSTKFKKDEYYYVEDNLNYSWLIKFIECDQNNIIAPSISIITNSFYTRSNWGELSSIKSSRLATSEEKVWLEECIKLNKFVPKDQIKSEYLKVEKLVEGCWYKRYDKGNCNYLVKIKKAGDYGIDYYCYYNYTGNFTHGLSLGPSPDKNYVYKQASNEEVLKYFPDEKFDNKWIPQIGEYVIGVGYPLSTYVRGKLGIYIGEGVFDFNGTTQGDREFQGIRKALPHEIPTTIDSKIAKARSILDDLDDYGCEAVEMKVEVTFKPKEVSKSKKTRLQLYEEITPIKVEEIVKLTVKSKINKNK